MADNRNARQNPEREGAPALDDVRTAKEAEADSESREAGKAAGTTVRAKDDASDSPKRHGDSLAKAVRTAAGAPEVEDEP